MATIASLFTTAGMMLLYKAYTSSHKLKKKVPMVIEEFDINLPQYQKALQSITTRDPKTIKELPPELLFYLQREKCVIPYIKESKNSQGWLTGHFVDPQQTDYAALCLTPQKEMTIKILFGEKRPCPISIGYGMIQKYIVPEGTDNFSFGRVLLKANEKRLDYYAYKDKLKRPAKGQEGIEDTLLGRGSLIYYCLDHRWVALGTDE